GLGRRGDRRAGGHVARWAGGRDRRRGRRRRRERRSIRRGDRSVKLRWLVVLALVAAASCSLNPQPYPPDTNDGGKGGFDASGDVANAFGDSGGVEDASEETSPPPESDAGGDSATDAETDAETDAATDAEADAETDAEAD